MLSDSLHVSLTWHSLVSHFALLQTLLTLVSYLASMHVALTCMLLYHTLVSLVSHFALTCPRWFVFVNLLSLVSYFFAWDSTCTHLWHTSLSLVSVYVHMSFNSHLASLNVRVKLLSLSHFALTCIRLCACVTLLSLVSYLAFLHVALTCITQFALTCISLCACVTMPYTVSYLASFLVAHFLTCITLSSHLYQICGHMSVVSC